MNEPKIILCELFQPVDILVHGKCLLENPFFVEVKGVFKGPGSKVLVVPGFFEGDLWVVRFSPVVLGTWTYELSSAHIHIKEAVGEIICVENTNPLIHGSVKVNPHYPHHFCFEDGTPYFMMGYEANWLWALGLHDPEVNKVRELAFILKSYGYNLVLMNVYAHDHPVRNKGKTYDKDYGPPDLYAWEGTNEHPDHSRLNIEFFRNMDRVIRCLMEQGIVVHLYFKVYNKEVHWPKKYSAEDSLYFSYVTARYQAFPNIIWDFSKECRKEPDKEYVASRLKMIKALDGYGRLVTVHDDEFFYSIPGYNCFLDFYTAQQHFDYYTTVLLEKAKHKWPVFNAEYGYEHRTEENEECTAGEHSGEEIVHRACQIVMAGGYPGYYYKDTAFDVIDYSFHPRGYSCFRNLYNFFTSIEWWKLEPHPEFFISGRPYRCLAIPGKEYLFYCDPGVTAVVRVETGERSFHACWVDILKGKRYDAIKLGNEAPLSWLQEEVQSTCRFKSPSKEYPLILYIESL